MQLSRRDAMDLLRSAGGVLLAVGAVTVLIRESGRHGWSELEQLIVVLVPTVVLYALAVGPREPAADTAPSPWRSVLVVVAILLWPVALLVFLQWVGADTSHPLYGAGVFALTGALAGYAVRRAHAPYAALLAGLALLVAWLLLWDEILEPPSVDVFRWLLIAAAVLLLGVAVRLSRSDTPGAGELAAAGGIAAVAAGVLGVIIGLFVGAFRSILLPPASGVRFSSSAHAFSALSNPVIGKVSGLQHFGWDLYLLIVSLALVWIGSRARARGLGYVGAAGLLGFLVSVGEQVTRIESGHAPTHDIVGWPLALLLLGVAGLVTPALIGRDEPEHA